MFSRDFTITKNYDVLNQKYISTSCVMPWRYTSVNSDEFLPVLPENIKEVLSTAFNYKYVNSTKIIEDDLKYLQIDHIDNQIIGYEVQTMIETRHLFSYSDWLHFSSTTLGIENVDLYDKMVELTDKNYLESYINSVRYDTSGNTEGIYFFNPNYILNENQKNGDFFKITNFCDFYNKHSRDELFLSSNDKVTKTRLYFAYPYKAFATSESYGRYKTNSVYTAAALDIKTINKAALNDGYLLNMIDDEIITEENVNYIQSVLLKNSRIIFEYEWDENYNIKNLTLLNTIKYNFKDD